LRNAAAPAAVGGSVELQRISGGPVALYDVSGRVWRFTGDLGEGCGTTGPNPIDDIHYQGRQPLERMSIMENMERKKQPRPRRPSSKEVKAEVVELVRQPGHTVHSVAGDLDLTETAVRDWVRQADIGGGRREGLTTASESGSCGDSRRRLVGPRSTDRVWLELVGPRRFPRVTPHEIVRFTGTVLADRAGYVAEDGVLCGRRADLLTDEGAHIQVETPNLIASPGSNRPMEHPLASNPLGRPKRSAGPCVAPDGLVRVLLGELLSTLRTGLARSAHARVANWTSSS